MSAGVPVSIHVGGCHAPGLKDTRRLPYLQCNSASNLGVVVGL